jgi:hypothetical protein
MKEHKEHIAAIAALAVNRSNKTALRICGSDRGIRPPLLPDKPVPIHPSVDPEDLQLQPRPLNRVAPAMRQLS